MAKYLEKEFGTPYEVGYPFVDELIPELGYERKKILIIHQQVIANAIRQEIRTRSDEQNTEVTVASWFMMKSELSEEGDLSLKEEMDYCKLVQNGNYDMVFADENMRGLVPGFKGTFVNVRHFAVSGKLQESYREEKVYGEGDNEENPCLWNCTGRRIPSDRQPTC